jgi:AcrR family transcriptional regulator
MYHFPSKDHLLDEALRYAFELASARHQAALDGIDDARDRLIRTMDLQLPVEPSEVRKQWLIWVQVWAAASIDGHHREVYRDLYGRWYETIRATVRRDQRQGTFRNGITDERIAEFTALFDGMTVQVLTRAFSFVGVESSRCAESCSSSPTASCSSSRSGSAIPDASERGHDDSADTGARRRRADGLERGAEARSGWARSVGRSVRETLGR